jgi:tetratricopeptide (TPR) repeat protein
VLGSSSVVAHAAQIRVALLATALQLASPAMARADEPAPVAIERAAQRFAEGERAFERGDFVRAATEFEAAYRENPHPTALWNAGFSWERAGERVKAANFYRRFLAEAPNETQNRDRATASLNELGKTLGRIEIVAPEAESAELDQRDLGRERVVYVDPGTHLVTATIAGNKVSAEVAVDGGQTRTVVLAAKPVVKADPPAEKKPPLAVVEKQDSRGATPWLLLPFAGVTALGVGLVIWSGADTLVARAQYDELSKADQFLLYDQGKLKQDRTNVLIGVTGGLALVTGAIAVFAIDWGAGKPLVALGPGEARVVVPF